MCFEEIGQLTIGCIRMEINEFIKGLHANEVRFFLLYYSGQLL